MRRKLLIALALVLLAAGIGILLYPSVKTAVFRQAEKGVIRQFEEYRASATNTPADTAENGEEPETNPDAESGRTFPELWDACAAFNEHLVQTGQAEFSPQSWTEASIRLSDYGWEQEIFGYYHAQSHELQMITGAVGYLRGDFGSSGRLFYTSWFDISPDSKVPEFKAELDAVINALHSDPEFHRILADRYQMTEYCRTQPDSALPCHYASEYVFRVNTERYAYLIWLKTEKGDYNFYVHCYEKKALDSHLERSARGIRFITPNYAEKFRLADGDQIRIVRPEGDHIDRTVRYIDDYHLEVGIGPRGNLYHICEFAERMEQNGVEIIPLRASLPEQCHSILPSTGGIILIKRGDSGYYQPDIPDRGPEENRKTVDALNQRDGVTPAQEHAMLAGSMMGWATPAADPKNYTETGTPVRPTPRNKGEAR